MLTTASVIMAALPAWSALASPGDRDPSFGKDGRVVTAVGDSPYSTANAVAVQSDGKIVAAGVADQGIDFAVARYLSDGSLDPTFGTGGIVTTSIGSGDGAAAIAIDSKDRIVVVGQTYNTHGNSDFVVLRYRTNGILDPTFAEGGIFIQDILAEYNFLNSVAVDASDRIAVGGITLHEAGTTDMVVGRLTRDGREDPRFPISIFKPNQAFTSTGGQVAFGPGGTLVLAGQSALIGQAVVARWLANGRRDDSFGTKGYVTFPFEVAPAVAAVAVLPDGEILVGASPFHPGPFFREFAVARLMVSGGLDGTFGVGGIATVDPGPSDDVLRGMEVAPDGTIALAGMTDRDDREVFGVARLTEEGSLDRSFGRRGVTTTPFHADIAEATSVAVSSDGRIVVAGHVQTGTQFERFALARYLAA
jgi:uncharacterized delta-60 repeat protein